MVSLKSALVAAVSGNDNRRSRSDKREDDKIVQEAKDRFKRCQDWEATARKRYEADIKFCEGDSDNLYQWDRAVYNARINDPSGPKPALTVNKTRQHCLQIVNDARQNKAQIRIRPTGDGATYEAAQVFEGVCRHIEYISNATEAYEAATWHQVAGGWGYWRIITDYVSPDSFDQEIYIRRISNPMMVYLDPDISEFDGSDARFGFVFEDLSREEFDAKYPKFQEEVGGSGVPLNNSDGWNDKDHVRVAEYYRKSDETDKLLLLLAPNGENKSVMESEIPGGRDALPPGIVVYKERTTTRDKVEWFKIAGDKIVDRGDWAGRYIPLVRCVGEETIIDGELDRKGHTRSLKDPQRMYNFWTSSATEHIALQAKAPWVGPARAFEGHETEWANANRTNAAYLTYNDQDPDTEQPIQAPTRMPPPQTPTAYIEGMRWSQQELMMASGQYQSQFGENENAKSGVAINARQRQGDNATYHYIDHLAQAIRFTGRILIDLIPKIYDTERTVKILAENGDETDVKVAPGAGVPHQQLLDGQPANAEQIKQAQANPDLADKVQVVFDPTVGKYEVQADVGPSFGTKREEAFNALSQIMAQNAEAFKIGADIMFRAADFPMADELAERIKRTIPPAVLGQGESPEVQQIKGEAQQQVQSMQQIIAQLVQENADKDLKLKQRDAETQIKEYQAETARMQAIGGLDPEAMKPVIRQLISEALGTPIVPLMGAHAEAEAIHLPQPAPGQEGAAPTNGASPQQSASPAAALPPDSMAGA
jgi:hypothetical protein